MIHPLQDWHSDPTNREQLERELSSPILLKAFNVLMYCNLPSKTEGVSGGDAITSAAMNNDHLAGFYEFPDQLRGLTIAPKAGDLGKKPKPFSEAVVLEWARSRNLVTPEEPSTEQP